MSAREVSSAELVESLESVQPRAADALDEGFDGFFEPEEIVVPSEEVRHSDASEEGREKAAPMPSLPFPPSVSHLAKRLRWRQVVLIGLVVFAALVSASGLLFLRQTRGQTSAAGGSVGAVYFQSSGQFDQTGSTGLNDKLFIDLHRLVPPAAGKMYHAWLLGDQNESDVEAMYLGTLQVNKGNASMTYTDPQHRNLLVSASRFLVTEDDATQAVPSYPADRGTWRYEGSISQIPNPNDKMMHSSVLDHIRHLLVSEPQLAELGLQGGLDLWFYRNSAKLLEWTGSARDDWANKSETTAMHLQIIRTLDYLDGFNEVQRDVPAGTPFLVDKVQVRMGLLELEQGQSNPPGLIYNLQMHLASLDTSPGRTDEQHTLFAQIIKALDQTTYWLQQTRQVAKQLVVMDKKQLTSSQAQTLLNELADDANNAYGGTADPATGATRPGALGAYTMIQRLASIQITATT